LFSAASAIASLTRSLSVSTHKDWVSNINSLLAYSMAQQPFYGYFSLSLLWLTCEKAQLEELLCMKLYNFFFFFFTIFDVSMDCLPE